MPIAAIIGGVGAIGGALISSNASKKQANAITDASNQNNATQLQIFNQQRADLMPWMNTGKAALSQIEQLLGLRPAGAQTAQTQQGAYAHTGAWMPPTSGGVDPYGRPVAARLTEDYDAFPTVNALSGSGVTTQPVGQPTQVQDTAGQFGSFWNAPGTQFRLEQGQRQLNTGLASRGQLFSGDAGRAAIEYGQNFASNEFNDHLNRLFNVAGMGQTSTGQSNALASGYANNISQNNMAAAQAKASSYGTQANAWQNALGTIGGIGMRYF